MNISKEVIDDLNAVIKVHVSPEDYEPKVESALREYKKKVNLPGFRKGHVPMGMVKKMAGKSVLAEELNKILSESLQKYISEEKLEILGNPLPKEDTKIDFENQTEFDFEYEVGLAPKFEVNLDDKLKVEKYKVKVDDKLIEKYVDQARRRYGKMTNPEVVEEKDMVYGTFQELNDDGSVKEDGIKHQSIIVIEEITDKKLQKEFIGKMVGDAVVLDPHVISSNEIDAAAALGIKTEEFKTLKSNFKFTIEKINRLIPAEINQDFFDKIYGPNVVKSEEEFRNKIKEEIEKGLELDSDRKFKMDVQDKLIDKLKLKLPDAFLKKWILASNEKPISPKQVEKEYDLYAKSLIWQIIENKIFKNYDVKVDFDEVVNYTIELIKNQMGEMAANMSEEELKNTAHRVLQNQEEARNIYGQLYDNKLMELFKEKVNIKEKEISYDEFVKLFN
ncbi:MAG: trigger factor [Vicingaceae bacterium]